MTPFLASDIMRGRQAHLHLSCQRKLVSLNACDVESMGNDASILGELGVVLAAVDRDDVDPVALGVLAGDLAVGALDDARGDHDGVDVEGVVQLRVVGLDGDWVVVGWDVGGLSVAALLVGEDHGA